MSRAVLVIITSKECSACSGLVKDKTVLEEKYKTRDDVNLIFVHSTRASMRLDVRNVHPRLQILAQWTPFIILITPDTFESKTDENELRYEIMNYKAIKSQIKTNFEYQHDKNGIDQFVSDQLKKNPLFSTQFGKGLNFKRISKTPHKTVKNNHYSLDNQTRSTSRKKSKYSKDEL